MPTRLIAEAVRYPTRDGVRLAADVLVPDDGVAHPTLLVRTPYGRAGARTTFDPLTLLRAGWAVVTADTRGRGDSEGDPTMCVAEIADGADTLDWLVAQPWCDGRVAMTGTSYLGFTQWQAAAAGRPALRAIAPCQAPPGGRHDWFYEGGAFLTMQAAEWGASMAAQVPGIDDDQYRQILDLMRDPVALMGAAPARHPLLDHLPDYARWIRPDDPDFWPRFDVSPTRQAIDVAGYHIGGWYDVFCEATIRGWRELRSHATSEASRRRQRLVIGPWPHGLFGQTHGDLDFTPEADFAIAGVGAELFSWLAAAVDGAEVDGGVRVFVMGSNRWLDLDDWPPPTTPLRLFPAGDGGLTTTPSTPGVRRWTHDPADPVPTCGGRLLTLWRPLPGPYDQRDVERRPDVLAFTSSALPDSLTVAGPVRLHARFATSARSADLVAKLVDVHPDGRAINVVDSVTRGSFRAGVATEVTVDLGSVAHTFAPGHRIRLQVASSNAPRFDPNPGTGAPLHEPGPGVRAEQELHLGATRLELPVLPAFAGTTGAAAMSALARPAREGPQH